MIHAGTIAADGSDAGGTISIVARRTMAAVSGSLLSARGRQGGTVTVDATGGSLFSSGTADASSADGSGGRVDLFATTINLVDARVDASGAGAGGTIRIGGDAHGGGSAPHAQTVDVSATTMLAADATQSGPGGTIVVWSDGETRFAGTASARGGPAGGDGGFIEVSSAGQLAFGGLADAGAASGMPGTVLLDPNFIVISDNPDRGLGFDLVNPLASATSTFGTLVVPGLIGASEVVLVTDPTTSAVAANAGAAMTFNERTGALLGMVFGTHAGDQVGQNAFVSLLSGATTAVTWTASWNANAGAVTFLSLGSSGFPTAPVSSLNSLVGGSAGDQIGSLGIALMPVPGATANTIAGYNYLFGSPNWRNPATGAAAAGAVTYVVDPTLAEGVVSAQNSLVGATANDRVGTGVGVPFFGLVDPTLFGSSYGTNVSVLAGPGTIGGNFVVRTPTWNASAAATNAGAVTFFDVHTPVIGVLGPANSLVGSQLGDQVGAIRPDVRPDRSYVVRTPTWNGGRGAVSWGSATTGIHGVIDATDSLVGANPGDQIGVSAPFNVGANGANYLVLAPNWNGGMGAVTFMNGTAPTVGVVSSLNSLVGSTAGDRIGETTALYSGATGSIDGVILLANGNYVVVSPRWHNPATNADNAGAVTWGSGTAGVSGTISVANSVVGSTTGDQVGAAFALPNGNYAIVAPLWSNGGLAEAGFAMWVNGATGLPSNGSNVVSVANSVVGQNAADQIGSIGTITVTNGASTLTTTEVGLVPLTGNSNYVIDSPSWQNAGAFGAGAVTWVNGTTGLTMDGTNVISAANSLVGTAFGDKVGLRNFTGCNPCGNVAFAYQENVGVRALPNGNYFVVSTDWSNGGATPQAGAVSWGNGATGTAGVVGPANSVIGSHTGDHVGSRYDPSVSAIPEYDFILPGTSNIVVISPEWDNGALADAGAITWINGATGAGVGAISAANSLIGTHANDLVGVGFNNNVFAGPYNQRITSTLYAFLSPRWANGAATQAGAITWVDISSFATLPVGAVGPGNSLVGTSANDHIGAGVWNAITSTGRFIVSHPNWTNPTTGAANAGAVTFIDPANLPVGPISTANSLIGTHPDDQVGSGNMERLVRRVAPGSVAEDPSFFNFVLTSPSWNGGRGAATWINGSTFQTLDGTREVGPSNSLVGTAPGDAVGSGFPLLIYDGNYAIASPSWNGNRGAVTWGSGATGIAGEITAANSLVGSQPGDKVGSGGTVPDAGFQAYSNFSYVILSPNWANGAAAQAGAVTWAPADAPITGVVSPANSLVGSQTGDMVGSGGVQMAGTRYVVGSPQWSNGATAHVGAVTVLDFTDGSTLSLSNVVGTANSTVGRTANAQFAVGDLLSGTGGFDISQTLVNNPNPNDILTIARSTAGGGQVTIGFGDLPQLQTIGFALSPSDTVTIAPGVLARILRTGSSVVLQAHSDVSILSDLTVNNPTGNGGPLTIQAGRSVIIDARIVTGGGDLTVVANETGANGVDPTLRAPGPAALTMGQGGSIDAGSGRVSLTIADGAGRTGDRAQAGALTLGAITAAAVLAADLGQPIVSQSLGPQSQALNSDIVLNGPIIATGGGDALVLATMFGNFVNNAGPNAVSTPNGRWLIYSRLLADDQRDGLASGNPDLIPYNYLANPPPTLTAPAQAGDRFLLSQLVGSPPPPPVSPPPPTSPPPVVSPPPPLSPPTPPSATGTPPGDESAQSVRFDRIPADGPFAFMLQPVPATASPAGLAAIAPAAGGTCTLAAESVANAYLQSLALGLAIDGPNCTTARTADAP
jgi:hypothetical protein